MIWLIPATLALWLAWKLLCFVDATKRELDDLRFFRSRIAREIQFGHGNSEMSNGELLDLACQAKHTLIERLERIDLLQAKLAAAEKHHASSLLSVRGIDPRRDALWH
jgi:hypothetical protein